MCRKTFYLVGFNTLILRELNAFVETKWNVIFMAIYSLNLPINTKTTNH